MGSSYTSVLAIMLNSLYSTRFYGLELIPVVIKCVEPVKCNVYSVLYIEACTIGGAKGEILPPAAVLKLE